MGNYIIQTHTHRGQGPGIKIVHGRLTGSAGLGRGNGAGGGGGTGRNRKVQHHNIIDELVGHQSRGYHQESR